MFAIRQALIPGLGLLLLTACGGAGSSPSSTAASQPSSVRLSGTVSGTSTAPTFNGQVLMTTGAVVTVDGAPGTSSQVQPGVVLQGTAVPTSQGLQLEAADLTHELEGPVTSLDLTTSSFVVLGKTVRVDALTQILAEGPGDVQTPLTLGDLKAGDFVEVYGAENADGTVQATLVERPAPEANPQEAFQGTVSALDPAAMTFQAGGFLVSYGSATVQGTLVNGAWVEVRGTASGTGFTASSVTVETPDAGGSDMELCGPISGLDTVARTFLLMSYKVDYGAATVEGTLANGAQVEVEGTSGPAGSQTLTAREVKVQFPESGSGDSNLEVSGVVSAVDAAAGTLTVGSTTYWTDASTLFVKSDAPATFAAVTAGETVEVHALSSRTNPAGQAYATVVVVEGD